MSRASVKLTAKWQLDAALLSRPVDLTPLVAMSRAQPENFLGDNTLHRLVQLLNDANENKSNKVRPFSDVTWFCEQYSKSTAVPALNRIPNWMF